MNMTIRNRIALFYMTTAAVITLLLFFVIYSVVHKTAYDNLDDQLKFETGDVLDDIDLSRDSLFFTDTTEWAEQEHQAVEVFPAFMQLSGVDGKIIKKTSNLKNEALIVNRENPSPQFYNSFINGKKIRQTQKIIITNNGKILGYIIVGVPLEGTASVVENLGKVLLISYPIVIILLFVISRSIASRSIAPLKKVTSEAENIKKENLGRRIELPKNRDEIYNLTETINNLLNRLEDAVLREKQFTADASHELRTPLSIIKGTLEVLVRKPRDAKQYEEKVSYCISEVDRISVLVDQLLMLARFESGSIEPLKRNIELNESIEYTILRLNEYARSHNIRINVKTDNKYFVNADPVMLDVILENLLSNAIKYSDRSKDIDINIEKKNGEIICSVKDYGLGMKKEQLARIFDRFYRSEEARNSQIGGHGIGLAIVKRLAEVQNLTLKFESEPLKGTTASIEFHS